MEVSKFNKTDLGKLLIESQQAAGQAKKLLDEMGVVYSLDEWRTVKRYCQRFGIENTETVSNWIKRGDIPLENIKEVEELNGLKLIKAVVYK